MLCEQPPHAQQLRFSQLLASAALFAAHSEGWPDKSCATQTSSLKNVQSLLSLSLVKVASSRL